MFLKLIKFVQSLPVPLAKDAQSQELSFRLWIASASFHVALASVVVLHFKPVSAATWTAIAFFGLCMVFYTFKKLTSAKIDLKEGELELNDKSEEKLDKDT